MCLPWASSSLARANVKNAVSVPRRSCRDASGLGNLSQPVFYLEFSAVASASISALRLPLRNNQGYPKPSELKRRNDGLRSVG